MNERINESLSALYDNEADELEIRRLLNQVEQDEQLLDKWASYQMIGALMRQETVSPIDLAKGVRQALDGEPMDELPKHPAIKASGTWRKYALSGAVAASVMVAVLVGGQWQQAVSPATTAITVAAQQPEMVESMPTSSVMPVVATMSAEEQLQLEEAQRKLQEYVLRHNDQDINDAVQPMLPFMQTVRFNQENEVRR